MIQEGEATLKHLVELDTWIKHSGMQVISGTKSGSVGFLHCKTAAVAC